MPTGDARILASGDKTGDVEHVVIPKQGVGDELCAWKSLKLRGSRPEKPLLA